MRHSFVFFFLLFLSFLNAQDTNIPFGDAVYHIYDRLEIKTGISSPIHSSLKAFSRKEITQYALSVDTAATKLSFKDRFDLYRIFKNNNEWLLPADYFQAQSHRRNELFVYVDSLNGYRKIIESQTSLSEQNPRYTLSKKPVLKTIYQTPANFFEKNTDSYYVRANPLMNLKFGKIKADEDMLLTNHRGLALRFGVDSKVYGYIDIIASQNHFPEYVSERITKDKALPGNGLYKYFNELHWFKNTAGYDYLNSQGYIGFNVTNHIGVQFGHGKNFIGNGYRSMLLSDFSNNYLYLKLNTKVWKFHYQNIFAEMTAKSANEIPGDKIVPKKYFAAHYLSFKPTDNIQIGIYEAVIFQRESGFELQYLNPVILYRTVEHLVGSPDNALIGLDAKANLLHRFQLYGQLMLDELKFDELIVERRGWWANKFGIQAGLKYVDMLGIDHLDGQVEFNIVRPYTFMHRDSFQNYTHYNQPLAHPLGANFKETLFLLRYQPFKKLSIHSRLIFSEYGEDETDANWGSNLLLTYNSREMDYGNNIGQGIHTQTILFGLDVSYEIRQNVFFDLQYLYRKKESALAGRNATTSWFGGGIRMNMGYARMDF